VGKHNRGRISHQLDFRAQRGQRLRFRLYWHGYCDLAADRIRLLADPLPDTTVGALP
jgi:hypothetical protein